jgi:hypothetical protein
MTVIRPFNAQSETAPKGRPGSQKRKPQTIVRRSQWQPHRLRLYKKLYQSIDAATHSKFNILYRPNKVFHLIGVLPILPGKSPDFITAIKQSVKEKL